MIAIKKRTKLDRIGQNRTRKAQGEERRAQRKKLWAQGTEHKLG